MAINNATGFFESLKNSTTRLFNDRAAERPVEFPLNALAQNPQGFAYYQENGEFYIKRDADPNNREFITDEAEISDIRDQIDGGKQVVKLPINWNDDLSKQAEMINAAEKLNETARAQATVTLEHQPDAPSPIEV